MMNVELRKCDRILARLRGMEERFTWLYCATLKRHPRTASAENADSMKPAEESRSAPERGCVFKTSRFNRDQAGQLQLSPR
jgi:hypothetical protein